MSAEGLRDAITKALWSNMADGSMGECVRGADALLDGPLRETLRLARIGAWVEADPCHDREFRECDPSDNFSNGWEACLRAAGAVPEPEPTPEDDQ